MTGQWSDMLIGTIAIAFAVIVGTAAMGFIPMANQLKSIQSIRNRWGDLAAKVVLVLLAILMLACGVSILAGLRPGQSGLTPIDDHSLQMRPARSIQ